jgi:hypothetical protein
MSPDGAQSNIGRIAQAYDQHQKDLPEDAIKRAFLARGETDDEVHEIEMLTAMWETTSRYIVWCNERTIMPADGAYEVAKGIIDRLQFIQISQSPYYEP